MTPYYQDDAVTIYHGDALQILPSLSYDVVVTDPPYGTNWKLCKAFDRIVGDDSTDLAGWTLGLPCPTVAFGAHYFPQFIHPGGRWFVWDKRVNERADRMPGSPLEIAWSSTPGKNVMIRCQHGGAINANGPRGTPRIHPFEKPVAVMRRLIEEMPTGIVLDPFMGSGSTLRAAKDLGRKAIGIEIDEGYCEAAANRMAQEVLGVPA